MRNNNYEVVRRLSGRSFQKNKMRNIFALIAIIITAMMFTTLLSLGAGVLQITQEQTMRQVGTRAHAGLKNVTMEQYEKISSHPSVKDHSYNILLGMATNQALVKRQTEIRYTEPKDLEYGFVRLKEGKLPKNRNEIVVDTVVMDLLGVPHEVGKQVSLSYEFMGKTVEDTFVISGWYVSDLANGASQVYVSRVYLDNLTQGYTEEDFIEGYQTYLTGAGLIQGSIMFRNSTQIEENVIKIITDSGYSAKNIEYGINWAYYSVEGQSIDAFSTVVIIVAFLVMMLTGYLIIYNIFHISILGDIRFYGLLKTIGATKRQIKRIVRRQAFLLSCIGIPGGLLLGYALGNLGMPLFLSMLSSANTSGFHLNPNPYIFMFGTVFTLLTVFVSCRKPGRIAGSVSPIEAAKYTENSDIRRKTKKSKHGARLYLMAFTNLRRNRKKTVITILSLSLSVVLLTEIVTFGKSFSMDQFLESMLTGDFMINSISLTNYQADSSLALPEDFYEAAKAQDGVESSARMYRTMQAVDHTLSAEANKRFQEFYEKGLLSIYENEQSSNLPFLNNVIEKNGPIDEVRYAYDPSLLEKLTVLEGTLDLEQFQTGKYILAAVYPEMSETYYKPGDKIKLQYHTPASTQVMVKDEEGNYVKYQWINDSIKEYEVMAVVDVPYSMTTRRYTPNSLTTIVPVEEFLKEDTDAMCFNASFWVEDEKEAAFQRFVDTYTTRVDPNTDYSSKEILRGEFEMMSRAVTIIGAALSFIVGIVGVLNFINTMLTSVITRKREMAMLQSIGLTDRQLKWLLFYEGIYYILFTAVISLAAGSMLSLSVIRAIGNIVKSFEYQFTALPFAVTLPIFLLIGILVPEFAYRKAKKSSIVERLREAE